MNVKAVTLFLLVAMMAGVQPADAQFWKKWGKKEERRKARPATKPKEKADDAPVSRKRRKVLEYPASRLKSRYRIDVLVPLYLDELVKDNKPVYKDRVPEKAATGLSFYEGIKLASDTLTALGYNIDVFIHDITQKGLAPDELVGADVLTETDLIIGALQSAQIPVVARFAKMHQVNFISVISPSDADVKDNPFFTMLQPTLEKHCELLKEAAFKKYPKDPFFLFYRTSNSVDSVAGTHILAGNEGSFRKQLLNKAPQRSQFQHLFDSTRTNVVFLPIVDNEYAEQLLQQLYTWFPRYQFEVYGMPSWKFINTLKKADAYPNVRVNFTSPFYYDMTTPAAQSLALSHRRQFGGRIAEMVFRGYEVLHWYAYLLQRYGTVYNSRQSDNAAAAFTKFEIRPQWTRNQDFLYNENEHLYLYSYQAGSYLISPLH